jgi:hypothetical protein
MIYSVRLEYYGIRARAQGQSRARKELGPDRAWWVSSYYLVSKK